MGAKQYYKLLPTEFAEKLVCLGEIKITTLRACWSTETSGRGRSDPGESTSQIGKSMGRIRWASTLPEQAKFLEESLAAGYVPRYDQSFDGMIMLVKPGTFWECDFTPDHYLYCVSQYTTRRMERRFSSGDDSWVEIFDPAGFFDALNRRMTLDGDTPLGLYDVEYRSRKFSREEAAAGINPATIKDSYFHAEHETRALWRTPLPNAMAVLKPKPILTIPELTAFCRLHRRVAPHVTRSENELDPSDVVSWEGHWVRWSQVVLRRIDPRAKESPPGGGESEAQRPTWD